MTDGPYNESIRGPGNRGLGGIWALLNSIAGGLGSLPQIATDIAAIRVVAERDIPLLLTRLTFLSGATAVPANLFDANGLPGYLSYTIASRATRNNLGASAYEQLASVNDTISLLTQALYGLETLGGDRGQLPRLRDELAQLNSSIGNASTSTPNFTALAWLALIANSTERSADCCEEGPVTPLDPFPIPTPFCGTGPAYWQECELRLRYSTNPPDPLDIYALWPPSAMTRAENIGRINSVDGSGGFDPGLGVVNGTPLYPTYPVCIAWSFAATPLLFNYGYTSVLRGTGDKYTNFLSSSSQVPNVGTELKTWLPGEGATARALQANFAFPGGTVVSGKVWISLSEPPPV